MYNSKIAITKANVVMWGRNFTLTQGYFLFIPATYNSAS